MFLTGCDNVVTPLILKRVSTMAILTTEQRALISHRKDMRDLGEDFKVVFNEATNHRDEHLIAELFKMFTNTPVSASIIVLMAKEYKKMDIHVDLRMEAGRTYLLGIANDTKPSTKDDILEEMCGKLDFIKTLLEETDAELGALFAPITNLTSEQINDEEVIKLIALGFCRNHPTLQQSFLRCMLTAAKYAVVNNSTEDNLYLRKIASCAHPLPFI